MIPVRSSKASSCLSNYWYKKRSWFAQWAQTQVSKTYGKISDQKISILYCAEEALGLTKHVGIRDSM